MGGVLGPPPGRLTGWARNEAALMRWPPINGSFTLGFHPATAREVKARGWIRLDGRYAEVTAASRADDDERVDFSYADEAVLEDVA
jgi:hypothetical protein